MDGMRGLGLDGGSCERMVAFSSLRIALFGVFRHQGFECPVLLQVAIVKADGGLAASLLYYNNCVMIDMLCLIIGLKTWYLMTSVYLININMFIIPYTPLFCSFRSEGGSQVEVCRPLWTPLMSIIRRYKIQSCVTSVTLALQSEPGLYG